MSLFDNLLQEEKAKIHQLKEQLLNALSPREVRYYEDEIHSLLDRAEERSLRSQREHVKKEVLHPSVK
ncbi:hypothetical protein NC797_06960 [Aquibacillus sp. 3ASR75-11]|uniref:Uncharacterized protein n=1 Tax=Terrihalobacillus insolitus TaxID=2950438 RepID=A0A9X3WQX3_9BACI|nr:hypothetical protein [Terrihalobacillus insolitus]MDC3424247.1 hypothetical protein [Terrihalobacillus insolitus]